MAALRELLFGAPTQTDLADKVAKENAAREAHASDPTPARWGAVKTATSDREEIASRMQVLEQKRQADEAKRADAEHAALEKQLAKEIAIASNTAIDAEHRAWFVEMHRAARLRMRAMDALAVERRGADERAKQLAKKLGVELPRLPEMPSAWEVAPRIADAIQADMVERREPLADLVRTSLFFGGRPR